MTRFAHSLAALAIWAAAPAMALSPAAHEAVLRALDDEYHAHTTYAEIIRRYGADRPFANIMQAEAVHASLLIDILRRNDLPVPANPYAEGRKDLWGFPASAAEACTAGVAAEIENIRLYNEELLPAVAADPDVTAVLTKLRDDSAQRHLPAFQRCAAGGQGGMGMGKGQGHGKGQGGGQGRGPRAGMGG